jgi:hypothetical protein
MRQVGSGNPPLHRLSVGFAFALSGHREVEAMIMTHSGLARGLAEQLGLPESATRSRPPMNAGMGVAGREI